jgi:EAL domain-containing protein (putative c-di-GMP-specific phosphodiesterase class I)
MGIGLSIDDFGTGYSNLHYVDALPVCEIKIDKSLVSGVHLSRSKYVIVDAVIRLCKELGISVSVPKLFESLESVSGGGLNTLNLL